jgi:glycosyltransferase involved in cell wall biosynthesis
MSSSTKGKRIKRIVTGIYIDPDFFPPTINAILNFAEVSDEVIVVSRNNNRDDFPFPPNVILKKTGRFCTVREMENQPIVVKAIEFLKFTFQLSRYSLHKKCELVVLYDHLALFSFFLFKRFLPKKKVWYHNHDMPIKELIQKRTIGGLAASCEGKAMKHIDFFSIPSRERLEFYSHVSDRIPVFIIPNYPSLKVYGDLSIREPKKGFRIIYQGFIGEGHSLEEMLQCIAAVKDQLPIQLILKGSVREDYKKKLDSLATALAIDAQVVWIGIGPYRELPLLTCQCRVGIGINKNQDIVNRNQGTASNKIYEYAACGLPVIVYDNPQFRQYLGEYPWVFFSDGSVNSLCKILSDIYQSAIDFGKLARESFEEGLNFETVFLPFLEQVTESVQKDQRT